RAAGGPLRQGAGSAAVVSRTRLQDGLKKTIGYFEALLSSGVDSFRKPGLQTRMRWTRRCLRSAMPLRAPSPRSGGARAGPSGSDLTTPLIGDGKGRGGDGPPGPFLKNMT